MTSTADLPTDVATLQALLIAAEERNLRKEDRIIRLEKLLSDFKRALYGAKSEKGHPDQYHLALEDIETAMAVVHAEDEAIDPPKAASKTRAGRGVLPKHLPRIEEVIAPDDVTCGCGAERHIIGEDVSERLDIVPAQFRVIVTRRPKYACRSCGRGRAGTRQTASDRRRHADRGDCGQRDRLEVRRSLAALPPKPNLCTARRRY